jgi:hypothetical protein
VAWHSSDAKAHRENEIAFPLPPTRRAGGGEGLGVGAFLSSPPTPAHIARAIFADPPHRFAGGGKKRVVPRPGRGKFISAPKDHHQCHDDERNQAGAGTTTNG